MRLDDLGTPSETFSEWNAEGVVLLRGFFSADELEPYEREWAHAHGYLGSAADDLGLPILLASNPHGWADSCPYMTHDALRKLCCNPRLGELLRGLTGDDMAVNLNLTGWVSTERDWHADSYLNEPEVGDYYAAVWVALADINPLSGVFQYVPGSHKWPQITRETIGRYFDIEDPSWPKQSETILTELFEEEIESRHATVVSHVPKRGDVLVWHGRLLHRGSKPLRPGVSRPALIAHYSGVHHRPRMPDAVQHENGGWYFPIHTERPIRPKEIYA